MELNDYPVRICVAGSRSWHDRRMFDIILREYLSWAGVEQKLCFNFMSKDFTNQRFGKLVVIRERPDLKKSYNRFVECFCDCGNSKVIRLDFLKNGHTQSCGCLQKELTSARSITHDLSDIPEYGIWKNIKQRCYNPKNNNYLYYGGRGVVMCDEWKKSFKAFYRDVGPRPSPEHTIDRKDNDKGYCKENCRWATKKEQSNNISTNVFYTHRGEIKNLGDWCDELGLNFSTVYSRIRRGWCFEEAIRTTKLTVNTLCDISGINKTISEWCSVNRLPISTVKNRLYKGWTLEEALRPIEREVFEFDGSKLTLYEWCCLMDVDQDNTYLRIIRGEKFEDIVKE